MKPTPQQQVETWPIERLAPYQGNPRRNDHAVSQMADFINRFGFRIPVLARHNGEIVDGHLRYKAALHLGLSEVPVIVCDDMSEGEIRAFRIAVNKAAELADWDLDLLQVEFAALENDGLSIDFTGFNPEEMDSIFSETTSFMHTPPPIPAEGSAGGEEAAKSRETHPPDEFQQFDDDIDIQYQCPKCGYGWSGKAIP